MTIAPPAWLDREAWPFAPRTFVTPHGRLHYVDEGRGEPVLFVHGNPTWGFEHRRLIAHLSRTHRCIAVDHLGFGLSDKPADASYLPQLHAANLAALIEHLALDDITLVVHDWGGPIALACALERPHRIRRVVVCNSWFWSVEGVKTFERFSALMGGPIGRFLCRRFNFFVRRMMPLAVGDREALPPAVHAQFTSVHDTPDSRKGTWVFPGAIIGQSDWLEGLWERRRAIAHLPVLLLWGMRDTAFDAVQLARWEEAFADHETHRFEGVGHFVPEELGERAVPIVDAFVARTSRSSSLASGRR